MAKAQGSTEQQAPRTNNQASNITTLYIVDKNELF